jgi:protoporphyrin/coproporphyrin ferrochelatase
VASQSLRLRALFRSPRGPRGAAPLHFGLDSFPLRLPIGHHVGQYLEVTVSPDAGASYDAILLMSFGGPEGPDDVVPFMENVTKGRGIPRERLVEVSKHYDRFGGVSPINGHNRELLAALGEELHARGISLPIYWGNRNWHPMIGATVEHMRADGVQRALAFVTSAFSSYSGCRQYREDIASACSTVASTVASATGSVTGSDAPIIDKIRVFYDHPGFIEPMVDGVVAAVEQLAANGVAGPDLVFSAHSIPLTSATSSRYVEQLTEASRLVAERVSEKTGQVFPWQLVYQSRSGTPGMPWLEPDIGDHLEALHTQGRSGAVVIPIGFVSDHMEVVWDLDTQARERAESLGFPMVRSATVGTDPRFVGAVADLVEERMAVLRGEDPIRAALGRLGVRPDVCPLDCCPAPTRPIRPASGGSGGGRPPAR